MPITVESSQWTGEDDSELPAGPVVWGEFADRAALDRAAERLQSEAWFRQSRATPSAGEADNRQVGSPDEHPSETGQRGVRQSVVGIGSYATAVIAAGVVIATGGAALPAAAAAAAAGGATLAAGEAVGRAADPHDRPGREKAEPAGDSRSEAVALGISATAPEVRRQAEAFLKQAGATRVWVQGSPGG